MVIGIDKAVIARLHHSGHKFEVLIDPEKALEFKKGARIDMSEILAYPAIYHDVRSTNMVPEQDLQRVFGTTDVFVIAERIIKNGELQLTTEQRRKMIEQRKNQIAIIIAKKGINPQTNTPHPPQRILNVMEKVGVNIEPFIEAEMQVDKVLKELKPIIPIKFQKITISIKVPPQHAGRVYSVIKGVGTITGEQWMNDGSLQLSIEILGGMQNEVFEKISSLTHGAFESKVVKREDV